METLEHVLNTFVDSFYQEPPKRNPSNYRDFVHYYQEEKSMDDIIENYPLLTKLNEQYHFIRSDELYLHLEYNIMKEMIPDLPNQLLSGEEYDQIIYEYERIPDHKKQRRRFERTVRFICRVFQSFSTGVQEFNSRFVQCPIALCVGIGKPNMNRNMRRVIYQHLQHSSIISSTIETPLQAALLKVYCRFMNFCGEKPNEELVASLRKIHYLEKANTKDEDNRSYNKLVRLFNFVNMDVHSKEKNHIHYHDRHFYMKGGWLYKKNDRVVFLDDETDESLTEILNKLNGNYQTVVIYNYVYRDQLMVEVNGRPLIKRQWNSSDKKLKTVICLT